MLGLSLSDFFDLTPAELIAALAAFRKQEMTGWKQTQLIMFAAMRPHYKKLSPSDCIALESDEPGKQGKTELTEEEKEAKRERNRKMDERAKQEYLNTLN